MKKMCICLALLMALLAGGSALAAASVSYEGGAEKFVFLPGSEYSESDLFESFKNVLPGDEIEQKITVKNDTDKQVRIYMRAEADGMQDRDFLNQLYMTVDCRDKTIFDAAPAQTAQLTANVLLGTFKSKGSTELTVRLTVPAEMGNEYMGRVGVVPWTFLVEEIPEETTPKTGDWFRAEVWCALAAALCAAIVVLIVLQRKRRAESN